MYSHLLPSEWADQSNPVKENGGESEVVKDDGEAGVVKDMPVERLEL